MNNTNSIIFPATPNWWLTIALIKPLIAGYLPNICIEAKNGKQSQTLKTLAMDLSSPHNKWVDIPMNQYFTTEPHNVIKIQARNVKKENIQVRAVRLSGSIPLSLSVSIGSDCLDVSFPISSGLI